MKREYAKLFSFLIGIAFILSGIIFTLTRVYKNNKAQSIEEENIIATEIKNVYESFKIKTEEFSTKRDLINSDISEYVSYYTGIEKNYNDMIEELKEYENLVIEVEDAAVYLKKHCLNESYSDQDANNKCNAYIINYEKTVNSFISDIEFFNSKIDEYNNWIISENEELDNEDKYTKVERYKATKYKEYIDINNDGTYLGRNSD